MAYELIKEGSYTGKIVDYGILSGAEGKAPSVMIQFQFHDGEKVRTMSWRGGLAEGKPRAFTLKSLMTCGFNGMDLISISKGRASRALDLNKDLSLVVEHSKPAADGKVYANIKYINEVGGKAFKNLMSAQEALSTLPDIRADLMEIRQERGLPPVASSPQTTTQPAAADDIPW